METSARIQVAASIITTLSVVTGIVISILSFSASQQKEAESRRIEASKPFLELRRKYYLEALSKATILASNDKSPQVDSARRRFEELYWGELCLVEDDRVEEAMIAFRKVEQGDAKSDVVHDAVIQLAHAMRDSLSDSWGLDTTK
jgi:hypothetical protein